MQGHVAGRQRGQAHTQFLGFSDDFAKKMDPSVKDIEELKNKMKINIQKSLDQEHKKTTDNAIIDFFTRKTKMEVPTSMLDNYLEYLIECYLNIWKYSVTYSTLIKK